MAYTVTEVAGPNSVSLDETESVIGTTTRRSSRAVNEVVEKVMPYMIRSTEKPVVTLVSAEKKGESKRAIDC